MEQVRPSRLPSVAPQDEDCYGDPLNFLILRCEAQPSLEGRTQPYPSQTKDPAHA
jgi:hypothetical protein